LPPFQADPEGTDLKAVNTAVTPAKAPADQGGAYPPTPEALNPGNFAEYQKIREKFAIPYDGLRHTAISAFVSKSGQIGLAAQEFGNSETAIRRRYLCCDVDRMVVEL
jgi:hypothetical protein